MDNLSATWRSSHTIDDLRMVSLSKEDIVRMWQGSERALLNRLQDTLKEKRLLEKKLTFMQKTLMLKPPWSTASKQPPWANFFFTKHVMCSFQNRLAFMGMKEKKWHETICLFFGDGHTTKMLCASLYIYIAAILYYDIGATIDFFLGRPGQKLSFDIT